MDRMRVIGGNQIKGIVSISGAKNSALPLMIASILSSKTITIHNVPRLTDVSHLIHVLEHHGVDIQILGKKNKQAVGQTIKLTAGSIIDTKAPYDLVRKMRASFWVIGPLLARCGEANVSLPGGCSLGNRPVDFTLSGLKKLGAEVILNKGYVKATAKNGLKGNFISLPKASVGATHTLMLAASIASGETIIENAAIEPEISCVAELLNLMGAKIDGIGTPELKITGVAQLGKATISNIPDRIETITYAQMAILTNGDLFLQGANSKHLMVPIDALKTMGAEITIKKNGIQVKGCLNGETNPIDLSTQPYPGLPTDLQAQFMAGLTKSKGTSVIVENLYENRYTHVPELCRMGADIQVNGITATVQGVKELSGAQVMATDIRASVSLIIAALAAKGETIVNRLYHLDRGFENLETKLSRCGANITRI